MPPAWAHSCGCKSRRKLITANEAKRNCMRATECGKEAWNVSREPMNKNRIEGATKQGEGAMKPAARRVSTRAQGWQSRRRGLASCWKQR